MLEMDRSNISDCFIKFQSRFPWRPRDLSRAPCAAELGRAPGPKGSSWQAGSAAERQLCPRAAPLHSAAGLGALTAGGMGRGEKERGLGGSEECNNRGQLVAGHICNLLTQ